MEKEFRSMTRQRDMVEQSKNPKNLFLWWKVCLGMLFSWGAHTQNVYKMTNKRSVGDFKESELKGRKVLVRIDFDIPLDDSFDITDDTKIRAAVRTIKFLMVHGTTVSICSHLGRPEGVSSEYSLKPLVPRLSQLLGVGVKMANDCIGKEVEEMVAQLSSGGVLLLENVRFYQMEEKNDPEFAEKLVSLADVYVNDAFSAAHRAHGSTGGLTKFLRPSVAGFQMQKELDHHVQGEKIPK